jgi:hypothetical protein
VQTGIQLLKNPCIARTKPNCILNKTAGFRPAPE